MLDNRRSDRLKLPQPLDARAGAVSAQIVEVSPTGLQLHHSESMPARGERVAVRFAWSGASIELPCVVIWTSVHQLPKTTTARPLLVTGLRIATERGEIDKSYARLLTHFGGGEPPSTHYLFCELVNGTWRQSRTPHREQPTEGFTVSATEDASQVERLCAAYAGGDSETRKLIRTLAALSIKKQQSAEY